MCYLAHNGDDHKEIFPSSREQINPVMIHRANALERTRHLPRDVTFHYACLQVPRSKSSCARSSRGLLFSRRAVFIAKLTLKEERWRGESRIMQPESN